MGDRHGRARLGRRTDGKTEDSWALARQTADNVKGAHEKLLEMGEKARTFGLDELAARLESAAGRLGTAAGLAAELQSFMKDVESLALLSRLCQTTGAVLTVDMRDPSAAETFDHWFAAMGETGEILAGKGGAWGAVLGPFATFVKLLGEADFFTKVRTNFRMQGAGRANGLLLDELEREGL